MAHQRRLVLHRAHGNEALARTSCRLANRRRVGCVVLVAPNIGLHVRRRDEPHRKAEFQQLPPPVMCRGAGLHRYDTPRKRVKKLQKRSAIDRAGNHDRARHVDRVNAEDPLGQIKPHARDRRGIDDRLAHGRPPLQMALQTTTILARLMPFGAPSTPSAKGVRRERRRFPVGASPTRRKAPAGSNRSSHGGDEMAEAFGVAGHI